MSKRQRRAMQFQLVDIEYEVRTDAYHPVSPVITLYGRQLDGTAVRLHVRGFFPYLYLEMPRDVSTVLEDLNRQLHASFQKKETDPNGKERIIITNKQQHRLHRQYVKSVEPVTRRNVYGYNKPATFLKVTLYNPKDVATVRNSLWERKWGHQYGRQTYEADFLFVLRFMVDKDVRGAGWIEIIDPDKTQIVGSIPSRHDWAAKYPVSTVHANQVRAIDSSDSAPFRILSFDIEVKGASSLLGTCINCCSRIHRSRRSLSRGRTRSRDTDCQLCDDPCRTRRRDLWHSDALELLYLSVAPVRRVYLSP